MNSKLVWRDNSKDLTSWKLAEMSLYTTKGKIFQIVPLNPSINLLTLDSYITIQMMTGRPNGIFSDIAIDSISVSQCQCNSGSLISIKISKRKNKNFVLFLSRVLRCP